MFMPHSECTLRSVEKITGGTTPKVDRKEIESVFRRNEIPDIYTNI